MGIREQQRMQGSRMLHQEISLEVPLPIKGITGREKKTVIVKTADHRKKRMQSQYPMLDVSA